MAHDRRPGTQAPTAPRTAVARPATGRTAPTRRPRWWVFHLVMLGVVLVLTLGTLAAALIAERLHPEPGALFWVSLMLIAWLVALVLIPVWIAWSIARARRWRARA